MSSPNAYLGGTTVYYTISHYDVYFDNPINFTILDL